MYSLILKPQFLRPSVNLVVINSYRSNLLKIAPYWALKHRGSGDCSCSQKGSDKKTSSGPKSKHQILYIPYREPLFQPHDAKNMALKRPMSPHLTLYAPTNPAMTSIVERITGTILTFYALMLASGSLFLSNGVETYVSIIQSLDMSRPLIFLVKLAVGAPFAFHYLNGIRFCMWNAGKMLHIKEVYESANKVFIGTAIITLFFSIL